MNHELPLSKHTTITLTVAIPTFNRRDSVGRAVLNLLTRTQNEYISVLVSDNASTDGTAASMVAIAESDVRCQFVAGDSNRGWWGQMERIAEHNTADYVMLLSDEDDSGNLSLLLEELAASRPSFALPPRKVTGRVNPDSMWANGTYLSGLIVQRQAFVDAIAALQPISHNSDNQFLTVYPQVAIIMLLWLRGDSGVILTDSPYASQRQRLPGSWYPDPAWELPTQLAERIDSANPGRAAFKSLAYQLELLHDLSILVDSAAPRFVENAGPRSRLRKIFFRRWLALRTARLVDEQLAWQYPRVYDSYRDGVLLHHISPKRFARRASVAALVRLRRLLRPAPH